MMMAELKRADVLPLYCSRERIVYITPGIYWNASLRDFHDRLYGEPDPKGHVRFIVHRDAVFLSRSPDLPALRTGAWP